MADDLMMMMQMYVLFLHSSVISPSITTVIFISTMKQVAMSRKPFGAVLLTAAVMLLLPAATTFSFQSPPSAIPFSQQTRLYSSSNDEDSQPNKKKKKTKGFTINPNLVGSISSDGILSNRRQDQPARRATASTSLGKPTKRKQPKPSRPEKTMSKKNRQRTANGAVDSRETLVGRPEEEQVQVLEAKRGSKTVTIVRYVL